MIIQDTLHQRLRGEGAGHADILEHLPFLAYLAAQCVHVTEFGVRTGNSTVAFLAGLETSGGGILHSYDLSPAPFTAEVVGTFDDWKFTQADTAKLDEISRTDLLFLDTLHTADQVRAELKHAHRVRKFLVFHDTVTFAVDGENGQPGIMAPIVEFLQANQADWSVLCHMTNNNGLLVLSRR